MECTYRVADATAADLRYLGRLDLCGVEAGQSDVGATVHAAERDRVDIAQNRVIPVYD